MLYMLHDYFIMMVQFTKKFAQLSIKYKEGFSTLLGHRHFNSRKIPAIHRFHHSLWQGTPNFMGSWKGVNNASWFMGPWILTTISLLCDFQRTMHFHTQLQILSIAWFSHEYKRVSPSRQYTSPSVGTKYHSSIR